MVCKDSNLVCGEYLPLKSENKKRLFICFIVQCLYYYWVKANLGEYKKVYGNILWYFVCFSPKIMTCKIFEISTIPSKSKILWEGYNEKCLNSYMQAKFCLLVQHDAARRKWKPIFNFIQKSGEIASFSNKFVTPCCP